MLPAFLENLDPGVYESLNYVVLDFETDTSHGDYGNPVHLDNQLLLACWRTGPGHRTPSRSKHVWGNELEQQALLDDISSADFIVAHNAKYELGWLRRCGQDLRKVLPFDTKLAEYVLSGNLSIDNPTGKPLKTSLYECCLRRGLPVKDPLIETLMRAGINPVRMPRDYLEDRCVKDVETTEAVFRSQLGELKRSNRLAVLYTRCLLTPVLADMEPQGMTLDEADVLQTYTEHVAEFVQYEQQMNALTGGINWKSAPQVAEFIYEQLKFEELKKGSGQPKRTPPSTRHPDGQRLTDQKTIDLLPAKTPEQREFVALRKKLGKVNAALTKSLEFYMGVVAEHGGRFYAEFNQDKTATHRLSSTGIPLLFKLFADEKGKIKPKKAQLHNQGRKFKRLFKASRPGWNMGEIDGSQLEFRVAAFLGNDRQAKQDIADKDFDIHIMSGGTMAGKLPTGVQTSHTAYRQLLDALRAEDKAVAEMRQNGKPESFKPLYGGEFGTPRQMAWYAEFRARYPDLAAVQAGWVNEVLRTKQLVTPWGMRYYWPQAKVSQSGYINVKSAVYNYPVQALATAEIIPVAVVYFWHLMPIIGLEGHCVLVNTVHDSLVAELEPGYEQQFRDLAKECFTHRVYRYLRVVYGLEFDVPLGAGTKIGPRWGEGKEMKVNVWPDGQEEIA